MRMFRELSRSRGGVLLASLATLIAITACGTDEFANLRGRSDRKSDVSFSAVAKASSYQGEMALMPANQDWATIMSVNQFSPQGHELQMTGSLVSSLLTQTEAKTKGGKKDTSTALAGVHVRFLVDGNPIMIGGTDTIVFNQRFQSLSITLQGIIESCQDSNGDGVIIINDECVLSDESVDLLLSTTSANSFTVVAKNLAQGTHKIEVQAKIVTETTTQNGTANAVATLGVGSLVVNQVREVKSGGGR